ncbi:MAG: NifB/NifX family molybdenum-iron cluster-binding protein [Spirochaetaceae bacterium]|nr:NifB/NifX family molybdenum-iron cluster-binding protein [Spirochaetaceae bacterium]
MKIAMVILDKKLDSKLDQPFVRAYYFLIHDTEINKNKLIDNLAIKVTGGAGIKVAQTLVDKKIDILIVFRLGENPVKILEGGNIQLFRTVDETAQKNLEKFKNGELIKLEEFHLSY